MKFCFPQEAALVNWNKGFEFLDKELKKITRDSQTGKRYVDKLVKVTLLSGEEEWLLIHVEIQNQKDKDFPSRMFIYNARGRDYFGIDVMSLAVLTDKNPNWRPNSFEKRIGGFALTLQYPLCKIRDYQDKLNELESSNNPIEIFIAAHLETQETRQEPQKLGERKWTLTRSLYEKGLSKQEIITIFTLIDWLMVLPKGMNEAFEEKLLTFEQEKQMAYVTSIEKLGHKRGKAEGRQEGRQEGLIQSYQSLLDQPETSTEVLLPLSKQELQKRHDQLKAEVSKKLGN